MYIFFSYEKRVYIILKISLTDPIISNLDIVFKISLQLLSSSVEVISHQPSPFASLKSLKIYPTQLDHEDATMKVKLSTEVKNYLLDGSPNATVTMVSREVFTLLHLSKLNLMTFYHLSICLEVFDAFFTLYFLVLKVKIDRVTLLVHCSNFSWMPF